MAASGEASGFTTIPDPAGSAAEPGASYLHLCSNETIHGVEFQELPDLKALGSDAPLVIDFSSHVASRRSIGRAWAWPSAARRRTWARPGSRW